MTTRDSFLTMTLSRPSKPRKITWALSVPISLRGNLDMVRNESRVVIKGHISLPPETVENGQQTSMFFVDTRPNEINDRDVMPRLASRTKAMAEHEPQGRLKHGLVGLLQAGFFIEGEDFMG